ncbi:hypothetical protein ACF06P_07895 [Streptomyces sp. NPDC015684]|uniref:hypothetical protein n=1 Tax=Streptomyces sp. NPDC015684 TaxID=3364963 RepID=UPI0037002937
MPMRQDSDHPTIRDAGFTVRQVDDRVTALCLSGALDTAAAAGLAATLNDNLVTSAVRRRLVLDMTGLSLSARRPCASSTPTPRISPNPSP